MQHCPGGEELKGRKVFCQEAAVSSAECKFGQGGAEHCLHAAHPGESCCLALGSRRESPRQGRRELGAGGGAGCWSGAWRCSSGRFETLGTAFLTHAVLVQTP